MMNNKINNTKLITLLLTMFALTNAMSQVDSSFTYQGELLDNGVPANGQYDINLDLIDGDMNPWGNTSEHSPVEVTNGLFSVNADFDINAFDGYKDFTVTVSIRKTSEGPGGAFTVLGSQTIQAVPLATNLTNGNATNGQVLTFNGFQWTPSDPSSSSPWTINGSEIQYNSGRVNIGDEETSLTSSGINVATSDNLPATFNGGDRMFVFFEENGQGRGYIGSFQTPSGSILDEDFEIGTKNGSPGNLHLVTGNNNPRLTVNADGLVGVGDVNPLAKLHVDSTDASEDPLRVRVGGSTKLWVKGDGSSNFFGDTKQQITNNGIMKYMVSAVCDESGSNIIRSYNGVGTGSITISDGSSTGKCVIDFPSDISNRYFQASAMSQSTGASSVRAANCTNIQGNLTCARFNPSSGVGVGGSIMVLVY